jgi:hypothetical protein
MANRVTRKAAVLLKLEGTSNYGVDSTPVEATNGMQVTNLNVTLIVPQNVDRNLIRPYFGASEQLLGSKYAEISFDIELAGAGTVAVAPAWGPALIACGFAQTITAAVRVDYTPATDSLDSATITCHKDGVRHKLLGARGTVGIKMLVGQIPMLSFKFTGLHVAAIAEANPTPVLTAFKQPQVAAQAYSGSLTFGATHSTTLAPAFVGGTAYPSQGIEVDIGNSINFTPLIGGETVDLTDRAATGKCVLDLSAAEEVAMLAAVVAGTTQSVGLLHGTVANNKVGIWLPSAQLINPTMVDQNGKHMVGFDMRVMPSSSGNDEVRIISSYA